MSMKLGNNPATFGKCIEQTLFFSFCQVFVVHCLGYQLPCSGLFVVNQFLQPTPIQHCISCSFKPCLQFAFDFIEHTSLWFSPAISNVCFSLRNEFQDADCIAHIFITLRILQYSSWFTIIFIVFTSGTNMMP